ncbi:MOSC domain-containing protein [Litoreibacter arenae]|uniref:MOSC domain-containing protein n=1 Tax=Litoreibacter arenae DSM 19593 TaxID=1123360 RepID=S9RN03_9RHOB|nr:MOSC domain-containing protein [Litoreibacter arenae]EPX79480.1 hypothetical protein thalar_02305 [Litoreibacter arenae DSM 19593]
MTVSVAIESVFAGAVEERWPGKPPSAIAKHPVSGRIKVAELGITVDAQADLNVHGGPDKALHHYPGEHYAIWRKELSRDDLGPGSFGENLSTTGLTEKTVCIGDIFSLGSVRLQVSQGRQPCWKLNAHTGEEQMAYLFQKTGRTGWYYRVLSTGTIGPDDVMTLTDRPHPDWSVARVTAARLTGKVSPADAATLANLPELPRRWRNAFEKMANEVLNEDTRSRLQTP